MIIPLTIPVSIEQKRTFLYWFMYHHKVKAHDLDWFLNDVLEDDHALAQLHFVDDITDCPKGIIITSHLNEQISFTFFKHQVKTNNVYTAYHEMNLYKNESLFIQVNFPFCTHNELYQAVIEDNIEAKSAMMDATEEILQQTIQQNRQEFLEKEINEALEQKNYEAFMYYSSQLKEIKS